MSTDQPDDKPEATPARSWKLYVRGSRDRPMVAEYRCPKHGLFSLEVSRDANGDPPGEMPCPVPPVLDDEWFAAVGRRTGMSRAEIEESCRDLRCDRDSPYCISAPRSCRVRKVEVVRGSYQKPELPTWTDTTNLGEGQDLEDWQADRDKVWEAERHKEIKELMR